MLMNHIDFKLPSLVRLINFLCLVWVLGFVDENCMSDLIIKGFNHVECNYLSSYLSIKGGQQACLTL